MTARFQITTSPPPTSTTASYSPFLRLLLCLSLTLGASTAAHAASFDCAKATSNVEHSICNNPDLSSLDGQLSENYQSAMANLAGDQADALRTEQRSWLKQRDTCNGQESCLSDLLSQRAAQLQNTAKQGASALDNLIASIPADPAAAAQQLQQYRGPLPSAWLIYLHQFVPASKVTDAEVATRHQSVIKAMNDDAFSQSVLHYIENNPKTGPDVSVLTLLRMTIERAGYENADGRPYVHCFIFKQQGSAAYEAFGALYGSSRDSQAPICSPQGDLFERPAWQQLTKLIEPMIGKASENSGTIRFASYADWAMFRLHATVSPEDFLKPSQRTPATDDPAQLIRSWSDDKVWPQAQREQLLVAIEPARLATMGWLQTEKHFSASDAAKAADAIVNTWLRDRIDFIGEMSGPVD
ncbi:lysozyme inhibitor LprI family protein [Serratia sp. (in: enterobacteria)]|uniref:lysozyme inhibitor LprI family protein n=1 Tax=Serratia sp. (in: enterobacteria) TaxID=616 RepID=UPI0039898E47